MATSSDALPPPGGPNNKRLAPWSRARYQPEGDAPITCALLTNRHQRPKSKLSKFSHGPSCFGKVDARMARRPDQRSRARRSRVQGKRAAGQAFLCRMLGEPGSTSVLMQARRRLGRRSLDARGIDPGLIVFMPRLPRAWSSVLRRTNISPLVVSGES